MGEGYPLLLWLSAGACLLGSVQFGECNAVQSVQHQRTACGQLPPAPGPRLPLAGDLPASLQPKQLASVHPPHIIDLPRSLTGYHIGILNTAEQYVETDLGAGNQGAALVGVLIAAATLGSLAAGRAADRLGPRWVWETRQRWEGK